ncbi:hypothetical protein ACOMHN_024251 [Nucella lapillus]
MSQYERSRCLVTSAPLFIFWALKTACDVIPFYTKIMLKDYRSDFEEFAVFVLSYVFTFTMMVLYAFADPVAVFLTKHRSTDEKICPETTASYLNKLTFAWLNKLMVLGYRRGIEMTDLWTLAPRDQSSTLGPVFERLWQREVQQCHRERTPLLAGKNSDPDYPESQKSQLNRGVRYVPSTKQPLGASGSDNSANLLFGGSSEGLFPGNLDEGSVCVRQPVKMAAEARGGDRRHGRSARPSLLRVLFRQFGGTMGVFFLQRLASDAFLICCPLILGELISHLNRRAEGREWQGYVLAVGLLVCATLRTVFYAAGYYRSYLVGLQVKSVIIGAVYNKALRISNAAKKGATSGEITSLMSVDAQRIQEFLSRMFFGVSVPLVLVAVLAIICSYVDSAALAGVLVLAVLVPSTGIAGVFQKKVQEKLLVHKDLRVRVFSEILNGIKTIKMF